MGGERERTGAANGVAVEQADGELRPRGVLDEVAEATSARDVVHPVPALRTARLVELVGLDAVIAWRGSDERLRALVAHDVEPALLREAFFAKQPVLVEFAHGEVPIVVGLLQTRRSAEVVVTGERIELNAARENLLRTGRAGIRLREDGEVELVGSRVSAVSRGLFRIVGRMLKLN